MKEIESKRNKVKEIELKGRNRRNTREEEKKGKIKNTVNKRGENK